MKKILFFLMTFLTTSSVFAMANPASVNCENKGGTLNIEKIGDGSEIGVCYFEDNRQCEEWALQRNECPVGGVKVTGYLTQASRYCAILGGVYSETGTVGENAKNQSGTCVLPDGNVVDALKLYNNTANTPLQNDQLSCALMTLDLEEKYSKLADDFVVKFNEKASKLTQEQQTLLYDKVNKNIDKMIAKYKVMSDNKYYILTNMLKYIRCQLNASQGVEEDVNSTFSDTFDMSEISDVASGAGRTIQYESGYVIFDIDYPVFGLAEIDNTIKKFVYQDIDNFVHLDGFWEKPYTEDMKYSLYIDYKTGEVNNQYITVKFNISSYMGGAHPDNYIKTFNFDKTVSKNISLAEYLTGKTDYLNQLSALSFEALSKNNDLTDKARMKEGTPPILDAFKFFNITSGGLEIYFPAYQVAPYAAGEQSVNIKLEDLK